LCFKKAVGCSHAIYTVRYVDHYIANGSTVNLCALDAGMLTRRCMTRPRRDENETYLINTSRDVSETKTFMSRDRHVDRDVLLKFM